MPDFKDDLSARLQFYTCCGAVMKTKKTSGNLPYAKAYAAAGKEMRDGREIHVQCLYILNNIQHWRGETATKVRKNLKAVRDYFRIY